MFFHQGHRAMPKNTAQAIPSQEVSPPESLVYPLPYWEHLCQQTCTWSLGPSDQIQPLLTL